jgi:hypothetical protein
MKLTGNFFELFPNFKRFKVFNDLYNTYIFRYSTAVFVFVIKWITNGGIGGVKPDRLRNDIVDLTYITYATYFDGLLTKDAKAAGIYRDTKELLKEFGV